MDIDKDFINGLGIPPDISKEKQPQSKMNNIDVDISDSSSSTVQSKTVAETPEDAITAMASNPIINNEAAVIDKLPESESEETATKSEQAEKAMPVSSEDFVAMVDEIKKLSSQISSVSEQITGIKSGITRLSGYDVAVETLKRSLSVHQRNEDNIYKELEEYKKNQYYNYIRPFFEFLINLLTDMISSRKQYQNDKDEFVEKNGQEVYDEILELHDYYIQQIESQLQIQGIEILEYQPNTAFIPTEQLISTPILTEDSCLVGLVASADSCCYKFEDKVIKKAKVHVYKAKPTENK